MAVAPRVDAGCPYYACLGCSRAPAYDFACSGFQLLTQAYVDCPGEPETCKPSAYGALCCFPAPGVR
jgi:hypothetical protein